MPLKSAALFEKMDPFIKSQGADLVKKINAVYFFEVQQNRIISNFIMLIQLYQKQKLRLQKYGQLILKMEMESVHLSYHCDQSIAKGKVGTADATFTMVDDDMIAMAQGKLNPQQAFMQGKMKIKGNMAAATKFTPDLLPKDAKF